MNDWTDLFKEKLKDERIPLPDSDWEVMASLLKKHIVIRRMKNIAIVAIPVVIVLSLIILPYSKQDELNEVNTSLIAEAINTNNETIEIESMEQNVLVSKILNKQHEEVVTSALQEDTTKSYENPKIFINTESFQEEEEHGSERESAWIQPNDNEKDRMSGRSPVTIKISSSVFSSENYSKGFGVDINKTNENNPEHDKTLDMVLPSEGEHRHPITLGVSLSYPLNKRTYLTTGLDYSYCFSKVTLSDNNRVEQQAHYIGIPLHIDVVPVHDNNFRFYIGIGAEARKCVFAKQNSRDRVRDGNIYYSAIYLAGLEYEPIRNIGIFIEPQYSYNFQRKNPMVLSAFTDSRNLFTLKAGINFSFR